MSPVRTTIGSVLASLLLATSLTQVATAADTTGETPAVDDHSWPSTLELLGSLAHHGYRFKTGEASAWTGTDFRTGARADVSITPVPFAARSVRIEGQVDMPAVVRLKLGDDARLEHMWDLGREIGVPEAVLEELESHIRRAVRPVEDGDCDYVMWAMADGRVVLWRDGVRGDADHELALVPIEASAGEAMAVEDGADAVPMTRAEACSSGVGPVLEDAPPSTVTVAARDLFFEPSELTIPAGKLTTITLVNRGQVVHNLTVDELGALVVAAAGSSGEVDFVNPTPGRYEFYCSVSGHQAAGMVGLLIVE